MHHAESKTVVVVGALACDSVFIVGQLPLDEKVEAKHAYRAIGGGGGNVAIILQEMEHICDAHVTVRLFTRIGSASGGCNTSVWDALQELSGIDLHDMAPRQACTIPENTIVSHSQGRIVIKMPRVAPPLHVVAPALDEAVSEDLRAAIATADMVVLQTNYPEVAEFAARCAKESGVPVVTDYSIADSRRAEALHETLLLSSHILAPGESVLTGMTEDGSHDLFAQLKQRYPAELVAVSNGAEPVKTHFAGKDYMLGIDRVQNVVDQLGTGDTRTALFAFFLLQGDDALLALKKASACSTLSVQYPGREWLEHLPEFMATHPLFAGQSLGEPDLAESQVA